MSAESPSKSSENLPGMIYDNPLSGNVNESPNFNLTENANSVENQVSIKIQSIISKTIAWISKPLNALKYTITEKPNIKQYSKYKVDDPNDIVDAQIISRSGKPSGKIKNWYNIKSFKFSQLRQRQVPGNLPT